MVWGPDDGSVGAAEGDVIRGVQLEGHRKYAVCVYDDGICIHGFCQQEEKE